MILTPTNLNTTNIKNSFKIKSSEGPFNPNDKYAQFNIEELGCASLNFRVAVYYGTMNGVNIKKSSCR